MKKTCKTCGIEKDISEFHKQKSGKYGVMGRCKECRKKHNANYYKNNTDRIKKATSQYYYNNIEKCRIRKNKYVKNRYKTDATFKIKMLYSRMLRHGLTSKTNKSLTYLGCTIEELKAHLQETAIKNGYHDFDINNYDGNKYHIDHIKPVDSYDLTNDEEVMECYHYSNLQILDAITNIKKSNTYTL